MSKKLSWLSIVAGVLSILAGFYLMANPALSPQPSVLCHLVCPDFHGQRYF